MLNATFPIPSSNAKLFFKMEMKLSKQSRTLFFVATFIVTLSSTVAINAEEPVSFNREVRPILAGICFNCHGPDAATNEGGVRLDELKYAIREGDSGELTIVPGSSKASELIRRIFDKDDPMPPADFQKQLTAEQKETLKRWVDEGAKYEGHWAFQNPTRPKVPETEDVKNGKEPKWARNPIDQFILRKMKDAGLEPSPEASRRTLIRRLALDLTGLPPTKTEIDNFLADKSPDAYEKLVDHFLSSEAYGEKMARPWLDHARYADSNGFQSDGSRDMWAWREWVIKAYNRNLPFDKFTVEQLAGDMLPNPTQDQIVATGFNRNHRLNGEGGRIVDEWFVETVIDRVETTGLTWLGLTYNCCRCHDHKYDPISQKEFYQMFAFFNSVEESGVLAPAGKNGENTPPLYQLKTNEHDQKLLEFDAKIKDLKTQLAEELKHEKKHLEKWAASLRAGNEKKSTWSQADIANINCKQGTKFKRQSDGSFLATGPSPANPIYEFEFKVEGTNFSGLLLEAMPDNSLPKKFLGRSPSNGNFVLTDVGCIIESDEKTIPVTFTNAAADFEQPNWQAAKVLIKEDVSKKNTSRKGWATMGFNAAGGRSNRIMLKTAKAIEVAKGSTVKVKLYHRSIYPQHAIGRLRVFSTGEEPTIVRLGSEQLAANILAAATKKASDRTKQENALLSKHFRSNVWAEYLQINQKITATQNERKQFVANLPVTMVMKEGKQRDAFILERGEYDKRGEKVGRALPAFLPPMPKGQPMNRLGLANWIVDDSNPLTSRVWVNRTWQMLFGTGIVKSTENFGTQADFPTHPELLDWLAVEFRDPKHSPSVNGEPAQPWDMKAFIKLLVCSATYRQSSNVPATSQKLDPENRWLSHGPRFRLDGETIRDQALAASGLLVRKIGGPSVRPYMPPKVWDETSVYGNLRNYKADTGEGRYRRTLYTIWKRTAAPPTMLLFDAPNRETCTIKRSRTNTPLQALSLLNENTFVEAAQALAKRMIAEGGETADQRVEFAFELLTSRKPTAKEIAVLSEGINEDLKAFESYPKRARLFLGFVNKGQADSMSDKQASQLAAYSLTANVLLNLDEVVMRQ